MQEEIAKILRIKGNAACLQMAVSLERGTASKANLHLRSLDLNTHDLVQILRILENGKKSTIIKSISLSYNPLIGDEGAMLLVQSLPQTIQEIGLVNCGIGDPGGSFILKSLENHTSLQMICMEQNNLSNAMRQKFDAFKSLNPQLMLIY